MRRILVVVVVVAAGCSGGSKHSAPTVPDTFVATPRQAAAGLCRSVIPKSARLAASDPATVKDFRETTIGTIGPAQTHRFPNLAPNASGAWCWTGTPGAYNVYEVAATGAQMLVASGMVGEPTDNAGRPSVP
jgi:hypothetical protein